MMSFRPMRFLGVRTLGVLAAAMACGVMPSAQADLRYTQSLMMPPASVSLPGMKAPPRPTVLLTTETKGRRQRREISVQQGTMKTTTVTLTLCDTGQVIRINPALKLYTVSAISAEPVMFFGLPPLPRTGFGGMMNGLGTSENTTMGPGAEVMPQGSAPSGNSPFSSPAPDADGSGTVTASPMIDGDAPAGGGTDYPSPTAVPEAMNKGDQVNATVAPMTGSVILTYATQDRGTETLHGLTTQHDSITLRRQASGCAGTGDTTTKIEIWLAPIKTGFTCPEQAMLQRTVTNARGCQIAYETRGDVDTLAKIAGEMPARITFFDKRGKEQGTLELQSYDQTALDDSLFAPPADYRQVAPGEFARAQGQAMFGGTRGNGSIMPMPSNSSGAYPAPSAPGGPDAGGGAFPAPTAAPDGSVNPSGDYPAPTPPAPAGAP